jgi:hypothetical protein
VSLEVVALDDGRIYVIDGNPDFGYDVRQVSDEIVAHFDHKYEARRAIRHEDLV